MNKLRQILARRALPAAFTAFAFTAPALGADVEEINGLLQTGKYEIALARTSVLLEKTPGDAQARFLKGLSLSGMGKRTEALEVFEALSRDFPALPEPYNNIAALHAAVGDLDRARVALEKAVRADSRYAVAYANLGDLHVQLAQNAYGRALELDPSNTQLAKLHAALPRSPKTGPARIAQPEKEAVLAVVDKWAEAWSARDVSAYLSYYAPEFRTPEQQPRAAWETRRHTLITNKAKITVNVLSPEVSMDDGMARVRFRQKYVSDTHVSVDRKTLLLRVHEDGWKIVEERSEK